MRMHSMTALVAGLLANGALHAQTVPGNTSTQPVPGPNTAQAAPPVSTSTQPVPGPTTARAVPPSGTSIAPIPNPVAGGGGPTASPASPHGGRVPVPSAATPGERTGRATDINPSPLPWDSRAAAAPATGAPNR